MRRIFLDCGSYSGETINKFKKSPEYSPDFEIFCFEPNQKVAHRYKDRNDLTYSNKAVWISDEETTFYVDHGRRPQGSTLINKKVIRGKMADARPDGIKVQAIDFSKWIMDNFDKDDYIILKMDIEGAEYEVLNKMIADGSITYINKMYIEWHRHKIRGMSDAIHKELLAKLEGISTLKICEEFKIYLQNKKEKI